MLTKFLIAVAVFIVSYVVLAETNVNHEALIALAIGIVAFIFAPARVDSV